MTQDKITVEELRGMFGELIPIAAATILQMAASVEEAREQLAALQIPPPQPPEETARELLAATVDRVAFPGKAEWILAGHDDVLIDGKDAIRAITAALTRNPDQQDRPRTAATSISAGNSELEPDDRQDQRNRSPDRQGSERREVGGCAALLAGGDERGERDLRHEVGVADEVSRQARASQTRANLTHPISREAVAETVIADAVKLIRDHLIPIRRDRFARIHDEAWNGAIEQAADAIISLIGRADPTVTENVRVGGESGREADHEARLSAAARALYKAYEDTTDEHVDRVFNYASEPPSDARTAWEWTVEEMREWAVKVLSAADAATPLNPSLCCLGVVEALEAARTTLASYADPTSYTDNNGEPYSPDDTVHPGVLAAQTLATIDAALAARTALQSHRGEGR